MKKGSEKYMQNPTRVLQSAKMTLCGPRGGVEIKTGPVSQVGEMSYCRRDGEIKGDSMEVSVMASVRERVSIL